MSSSPTSENCVLGVDINSKVSFADAVHASSAFQKVLVSSTDGEMKTEMENDEAVAAPADDTGAKSMDQPNALAPAVYDLSQPTDAQMDATVDIMEAKGNVDDGFHEPNVASAVTGIEENTNKQSAIQSMDAGVVAEIAGDGLERDEGHKKDELAAKPEAADSLVEVVDESTDRKEINSIEYHDQLETNEHDSSQFENVKEVQNPQSILRRSRIVEKEAKVNEAIKKWTSGPIKGEVSTTAKSDPSVAEKTSSATKHVISEAEIQSLGSKTANEVSHEKAVEVKISTDTHATLSPAKSGLEGGEVARPGEESMLGEPEETQISHTKSGLESSSSDSEKSPSPRRRLVAAKSVLKPSGRTGKKKAQLENAPGSARKRGRARKTDADTATAAKKRKAESKISPNRAAPKDSTPGPSAKNSPPRTMALEVWSGAPDEELPGGWPEGWLKKKFQRQSGGSKGTFDRYWYTPKRKYRLRSMVEVKKFISLLESCKGNEDDAWNMMKSKKKVNL